VSLNNIEGGVSMLDKFNECCVNHLETNNEFSIVHEGGDPAPNLVQRIYCSNCGAEYEYVYTLYETRTMEGVTVKSEFRM